MEHGKNKDEEKEPKPTHKISNISYNEYKSLFSNNKWTISYHLYLEDQESRNPQEMNIKIPLKK